MGEGQSNYNATAELAIEAREKELFREKLRLFQNSKEIALDILFALERDGYHFATKLKSRVLSARTIEEINLVMGGLKILSELYNNSN